jgi:hypothetical protein
MSSSAWSPGRNPYSERVNSASGVDEKSIDDGRNVILKSPPA